MGSDSSITTPFTSQPPDQPGLQPEIYPPIDNTNWRLISQIDQKGTLKKILPGTQISLFVQDNEFSGSSGCNRFSVRLAEGGSRLNLAGIEHTNLYCGSVEGVMQQESEFLANLEKTSSYSIMNEQLVLLDVKGAAFASFTVSPIIELTSVKWQMIFFTRDSALVPPLPGTDIFIHFNHDGSLEIESGCNVSRARFHTEGDQIIILDRVSSNIQCLEPAGIMEQEDGFYANLRQVSAYLIDGKLLNFYTPENQLIMSFRAFGLP